MSIFNLAMDVSQKTKEDKSSVSLIDIDQIDFNQRKTVSQTEIEN